MMGCWQYDAIANPFGCKCLGYVLIITIAAKNIQIGKGVRESAHTSPLATNDSVQTFCGIKTRFLSGSCVASMKFAVT
jgi:hypothetical protein